MSSSESPRTTRRKSLIRRDPHESMMNVESDRHDIENSEFARFARDLSPKLHRAFDKHISAYMMKIRGAEFPEFPRSDVVQQMKQTAMSIYTASELICQNVCDVPSNSALVFFAFTIGFEALLEETLILLGLQFNRDTLDKTVLDVIQGIRRAGNCEVGFSEVDVEDFVQRRAYAFKIVMDDSPLSPQRIAEETRKQSPERMIVAGGGNSDPQRPLSPQNISQVIRIMSPQQPRSPRGISQTNQNMSPQRPAAGNNRAVTPPRSGQRPHPIQTTLSPQRRRLIMDEVRVKTLIPYFAGVGRAEGSYLAAERVIDQVISRLREDVAAFRQARSDLRFSQSQLLG